MFAIANQLRIPPHDVQSHKQRLCLQCETSKQEHELRENVRMSGLLKACVLFYEKKHFLFC